MAAKDQVQQIIQQLHSGTEFTKIITKTSKKYSRTFILSEDHLYVTYSPSKKSASNARIAVEDIREIRIGQETDGFKKSKIKNKFPKDNSFSLIVGAESHSVNLVAPSADVAKAWIQGLRWAKKKAQNIDVREKQALWIKDTFRKADVNKDDAVDFEETLKLLKKMNMIVDKSHARKLFEAADKKSMATKSGEQTTDGVLDEDEFVDFYRTVTERTELRELFKTYAGEDDYWTAEEFKEFMNEEQKRNEVTTQWCESVIETYEPTEEIRKKKILSYDGFLLFMKGPNGKLLNPFHTSVYQDMKQPLNHYFIASSHNTYLMKDQLRGPSSVEAYIQALQKGCRCVEMDVWDGPDDEPIIYHGHTFTSKIKFRDAVEAVNKYAFEASNYPVILSLENHCSVPQQTVMARHLREVIGDKLYLESVRSTDGGMPSPEDLKGKILVKGKKFRITLAESAEPADNQKLPEMEEDLGDVSEEDEAAEIEAEDEDINKKIEENKSEHKAEQKMNLSKLENGKAGSPKERDAKRKAVNSNEHAQRNSATPDKKPSKKKKKVKLSKELSDLVILCKSVGFKGYSHAKEHYKFYEMSSLAENKAFDMASKSAAELVEHNKNFLTRIYPGGLRTNSSNYNPVKMWNIGSQIVALNYQTPCTEMDLNQGKFQQNGKSGYILKPVFLRKPNMQFNPNKPDDQYTQKLTLTILTGQQFPKPDREVIDPYVKVTLYGVNSEKDYKTEVVDNNGFNPVWNCEMTFDIKCPELALLRFAVYDHDVGSKDDFIGQYSIPVASIQLGYHHIPLLSTSGADLNPASLFVHTLISTP